RCTGFDFFKLLIDFENLHQEGLRNLAAIRLEPFDFDKVLDTMNRVAQCAIRVIEGGGHLKGALALFRGGSGEVVRMVFPAELVKLPLEGLQIDVEQLRKTEDFEIVHEWNGVWTLGRERTSAAAAFLRVRIHKNESFTHEAAVVVEHGAV